MNWDPDPKEFILVVKGRTLRCYNFTLFQCRFPTVSTTVATSDDGKEGPHTFPIKCPVETSVALTYTVAKGLHSYGVLVDYVRDWVASLGLLATPFMKPSHYCRRGDTHMIFGDLVHEISPRQIYLR